MPLVLSGQKGSPVVSSGRAHTTRFTSPTVARVNGENVSSCQKANKDILTKHGLTAMFCLRPGRVLGIVQGTAEFYGASDT